MKQKPNIQGLLLVFDAVIGAALAGLMAYQGGATPKGAELTAAVIGLKTLHSRLTPATDQNQTDKGERI